MRWKALLCLGAVLSPESSSAQSVTAAFRACVQRETTRAEAARVQEAYRDRGCTTDPTDWQGRRKGCSELVCWDAPPNTRIADAAVTSFSANGSNHGWSSTQYLPSRELATRICHQVHARSPSGSSSGRGWQKLKVVVALVSVLTQRDLQLIEDQCELEAPQTGN